MAKFAATMELPAESGHLDRALDLNQSLTISTQLDGSAYPGVRALGNGETDCRMSILCRFAEMVYTHMQLSSRILKG